MGISDTARNGCDVLLAVTPMSNGATSCATDATLQKRIAGFARG